MPTAAKPTIPIPSTDRYIVAFQTIEPHITTAQRKMLRIHYHAPCHTMTMSEIAQRVGYQNCRAGNLWYVRLGGLIRDELSWCPGGAAIFVLVTFGDPMFNLHDECALQMRPEVVQALEQLGWV